jgi:DNA-binding NarL/FixJ family response regulator
MADRVETAAAAIPAGAPANGIQPLRVLLAITDFPLLAAGYRAVIDGAADIAIADAVERRDRVVDEVARLAADIVVIDMPTSPRADCPSAGTIDAIRAARPAARILAIESACARERRSPAVGAGADGLLARQASPADVLAALRCLGRGETWTSPSPSTDERAPNPAPNVPEAAGDRAFDTLGEPAREVSRLAAVGHTSLEIARQLGVAEATVHAHRALIVRRLGLHRRVELWRYALRHGIVRATEL